MTMMRSVATIPVLLCSVWAWLQPGAAEVPDDPFVFFRQAVVLTPADRQVLDRQRTLVRVLPARDTEVAIFAAVALNATGEALVEGVRQIAELKRGPFVRAIRRFSDPPKLEDLETLVLDDADLEAILRCRPGNCKVKLSSLEMERLRQAAAKAGAHWKVAVQEVFRSLVLERTKAYLERGHEGLSDYQDSEIPVKLQERFSTIVRRSPCLLGRLPRFAEYLEQFPKIRMPEVESFLYWAKEDFGRKPVISVTHVGILRSDGWRGLPEVLVAGKQVFATHYTNGSLNLTAVVRGQTGSHNYLVYLNRSEVDVLADFLGWLKRALVERRLKSETEKIFQALRERLERRQVPRPGSAAHLVDGYLLRASQTAR